MSVAMPETPDDKKWPEASNAWMMDDKCALPGPSLASAEVMKIPGTALSFRLTNMLETGLEREGRLWKVPVFKNGFIQDTKVSSTEIEQLVIWLGELSRTFHFSPETNALGISVFHRLIGSIKVQSKYLKCIALTSLVLASKFIEEEENVSTISELVEAIGGEFSTAEIVRMERSILQKLGWDMYTTTSVDFVHIFHALIVYSYPHLVPVIGAGSGDDFIIGSREDFQVYQKNASGLQVALWTMQVQHCMACHQLWQFKGSTLALAIITLALESLTPDWFSIFTDLLKKAQVNSAEFILCKELVDERLNDLGLSSPANCIYIFQRCSDQKDKKSSDQLTGKERPKLEQGDCEEYFDGFKHLYSEEKDVKADVSAESEQKEVSPCPALHPVQN